MVFIHPNDFPLSFEPPARSYIVWTRVPIVDSHVLSMCPPDTASRLNKGGLWGFTGQKVPGAPQIHDARAMLAASVNTFVKSVWPEVEWKTAWVMSPMVRAYTALHVFSTGLMPEPFFPVEEERKKYRAFSRNCQTQRMREPEISR